MSCHSTSLVSEASAPLAWAHTSSVPAATGAVAKRPRPRPPARPTRTWAGLELGRACPPTG
eukprot:6392050-Pyramimonas_sp.AAC.1